MSELSSAPTIPTTLIELSAVVEATMQPAARGYNVAETLRQLAGITPAAKLADLAAAWEFLAEAREGDDGPTKSRRSTCRELSEMAAQQGGSLSAAASAWQSWSDHFSMSTDPRHMSMTRTFQRELAELAAQA